MLAAFKKMESAFKKLANLKVGLELVAGGYCSS
jgi:hypothetical protein